jgi:TAG lipase / steryl ester hydrolase / phospholipase A2 / LPA acyltransferase
MRRAANYEEWLAVAEQLDHVSGLDAWREDDASAYYHPELLREDIRRMRELLVHGHVDELLELLHESLYRSFNDILEPALYNTAHAGPKRLVTEWLDAVEATIEALVGAELPGWTIERKLATVRLAYRNLGRSALLLSGGATLGFYHIGVVRGLWRAGLLPEVIVGASMGAMIAAGICGHTEDELAALFSSEVPDIETVGLERRRFGEVWRSRSLMRPERMLETIRKNCGDYTFAQAYARSGRVLNISLMPTRTRQKPRILNHLTAPNVWIPRAALASSAVPGLFPPVALTKLGPSGEEPYLDGETWIDGSLGADLPTMRVSRLHNVNHFIVSQTQPHALPLLAGVNQRGLVGLASEAALSAARTQSIQALDLARRIAARTPLGLGMEVAHGLVRQHYRGDINIHPRFDPRVYTKILQNASREDLAYFVREGERATWPKLAMVRDATRIGRCLARCEAGLVAQMSSPDEAVRHRSPEAV